MSYKNIHQIEFEQLALNPDTVIIDVRTASEYGSGKIAGALTGYDFLSGEFSRKAQSLDKTKTYLLYCRSGNRSGAASSQLSSWGFAKVYNLMGGVMGWNAPLV